MTGTTSGKSSGASRGGPGLKKTLGWENHPQSDLEIRHMEQPNDDSVLVVGGQANFERLRSTKRSRKGCPECRRRKIKCDEQRPQCGQCRKRSLSCHLQDSLFKQHSLSSSAEVNLNAPIRAATPSPTCEAPGASWTRTSNTSTIEERYASGVGADETEPSPATVTPAISYSQQDSHFNREQIEDLLEPPLDMLGAEDELTAAHQHENEPFLVGGAAPSLPVEPHNAQYLESTLSPVETTNSISAGSTIGSLNGTQEELFLLRHYSECIAPWMDLLYRYEVFSREVLTLAREHQILRYAACAVAAKQLGQMRSPVSLVLCGKSQERIAAKLAQDRFGFLWYGAKYYEKAIQTLVKSITPKEASKAPTMSDHVSPAVSLSQGDLMVRAEGEDPIVRLLGTCILIQYEHLSANRDAWSGHLTGFSKLLDLIDDGNLLRPHPMVEEVYPWAKHVMEVKASFWNFVVNDLEESFVSHRRTRIDTENLALWRNMGLLIEDDGSITLTGGSHNLSTTPEHARDKVLSYTLIRLLCKLVDYLAPLPHWQSLMMHPEPRAAAHGKDAFMHLESQFNIWFQMLSPSFHPDGTFFGVEGDEGEGSSSLFGRELWFSNDLCSTTMMYYHMARMLLLIHRPSDLLPAASSSGRAVSFDLLHTFRQLEQQLQSHASEVIAIVRGTPCDAIKLRAIQPLYVAGRCCSGTEDRKALVEMLAGIQDNLGIATGYRIKALLQEWGVSYQDFGLEARVTAEEQLP